MHAPPWIRPAVAAMEPYVPGEQPRDRRYVKLNTNENPYPPSPRVLAAVHAALTDDLRLYPDPAATELRERAAAVYGCTPECVLAGNGSDELLGLVVRACADPGDRVVYPTPTYSLYDTLVQIQGATAVHVPYPPDFALPAGLAEAGGRVTFVCNPNSPSGTAVPPADLAALAAAVPGLLVIDEAYVDFADRSALPLAFSRRNVLVLRTFSKSFSLAGIRVGLAFGDPALIRELAKIKDSYNVNRLSLVAAVAALDDYAWMEANVARVRATRSRLHAALAARGFAVLPSQANFVLARRPGTDLGDTCRALRDAGVLVRHFPVPGLRDALRITVGTEEDTDTLLAALDTCA